VSQQIDDERLTPEEAELYDHLYAAVRSVSYVRRDGKIALVGVDFADETGATKTLELKMRERSDGYWQVAEISNLSKLLNT
jgi:hypothetical protein